MRTKQVIAVLKDKAGKVKKLNMSKIKPVSAHEWAQAQTTGDDIKLRIAQNAVSGHLHSSLTDAIKKDTAARAAYAVQHEGKTMPNSKVADLASNLKQVTRTKGEKGVCASDLTAIRHIARYALDQVQSAWDWKFAQLKTVQESSLNLQSIVEGLKHKHPADFAKAKTGAKNSKTKAAAVSADAKTAKKAQLAVLGIRGAVVAACEKFPLAEWAEQYPEMQDLLDLYNKCKKG